MELVLALFIDKFFQDIIHYSWTWESHEQDMEKVICLLILVFKSHICIASSNISSPLSVTECYFHFSSS